MFRVGVLSDTHGLVRPEALKALQGVDRIVHAGDIGSPDVLDELGAIAPVTAVRGNCDTAIWALNLPHTTDLEVEGLTLHVLHDVNLLAADPRANGYAAVVSGHSHRPSKRKDNGVLYFNPGSAGPKRFKLPVSLGFLTIRGRVIEGEHVTLSV